MVNGDSAKVKSRHAETAVAEELPPAPAIDICIASYKRPILLRKLLSSLIDQQTEGRFSYNIIVIDNDATGSAGAVVKEFMTNERMIVYKVEPQQNISLARNMALSFATGDFIATIDDDEHAEPNWLFNLYQTMITYGADVVMGPAVPIFPPNTPEYLKQSSCFKFPNPHTGATKNFVHSSASCLMRRALIKNLDKPFNPDFGLTGGSDSVLFEQLKQENCRFVWCREAIVYETIPANRAKLSWLFRRMFRNGHVTYQMLKKELVSDDHPSMREIDRGSIKRLPINFAGASINLFKSFVESDALNDAIKNFQDLAFALGFLLSHLKIRFEEYR